VRAAFAAWFTLAFVDVMTFWFAWIFVEVAISGEHHSVLYSQFQ
jgi:hypothetical protein